MSHQPNLVQLPEPHAVAPLNDPANVGRWVWHSWNGNREAPAQISRVSRAHVTIRDYSTDGLTLKVEPGGDEAAKRDRWSYRVRTEAARRRGEHRGQLVQAVQEVFRLGWSSGWKVDELERLVAFLRTEGKVPGDG